jgi:CRP-like cAMP-binding protein
MKNNEKAHLSSRSSANKDAPAQAVAGNLPCPVVMERPRLFAGISPDDYAGICRAGAAKHFSRGEILHLEGEPIGRVILLTSGSAKVTKLGRDGAEVILRLAAPGDVMGVPSLFSCGNYCTTAEAFQSCRTLVWDAKVFKGLVDRYPLLHQNMAAILDGHLRELEDRFREVATDRVGTRVAFQLLRLVKTIGQPAEAGIEVGLSREDLARMTGTTLFTVSRLLSQWEDRGVVKPRREGVAIRDVPSLCAIAQEE